MKIKALTVVVLVFILNQNTYADVQTTNEVSDESNQAVSWHGLIAQSYESQGMLCYELIKVESNNKKSKPQELIDDSRFISCTDSKKDLTKSSNRFVTVTGKIIGTVDNDNYQYPVVMADKIRKWQRNFFSDANVGIIKPRFNRSRLDSLLNEKGL